MRPQRQTTEEQGPKVPGYIVTFSDMVTLLLTFFVMLLTLADVQDPELFDKGRDAFLESLRYAGLGMFFGRQDMPNYGNPKYMHTVNSDENTSENRTIDARAEQIERIFEELKNSATAIPRNTTVEKANFSLANVHFAPGKADLNESSKQFLTDFCRDLQYSSDTKPGILYVLGLASEEKEERDRWLLSAIRAEVVAKYLRNNLISISNQYNTSDIFNSPPKWSVYSLGAGEGIDWTGINSSNSQILIAVQKTSF